MVWVSLFPSLGLLYCLPRECILFLRAPSWLHNSEHDVGRSLLRFGTCLGSPFAQASHMGRGAQTGSSWGVSLHRHISVSRSRLLRTHLGSRGERWDFRDQLFSLPQSSRSRSSWLTFGQAGKACRSVNTSRNARARNHGEWIL